MERDGDEARESGGRERRDQLMPTTPRGGVLQWTQRAAARLTRRVRLSLRLSEERRPEVPRYVVVGVTALAVLSVLTGFGAHNVCNFAGFVYPLYMSWKAVRSVDAQDDTQWLTYWVVYGFLNASESWARLLGLTSLPFYSAAKVTFLVWCFHPATRGADVIFHRLITPLLLRYEQRIDRFAQWWVGETRAAASDVMTSAGGELHRRVTTLSGNLMRAFADSVQPQAQAQGQANGAPAAAARSPAGPGGPADHKSAALADESTAALIAAGARALLYGKGGANAAAGAGAGAAPAASAAYRTRSGVAPSAPAAASLWDLALPPAS